MEGRRTSQRAGPEGSPPQAVELQPFDQDGTKPAGCRRDVVAVFSLQATPICPARRAGESVAADA